MLVRLWTTQITLSHEADYLRFAEQRSRAMFLEQPGCLGVFFLRLPDGRHTACSFWRDQADIDALRDSPSYQATAGALGQSGILVGDQDVIVYQVEGGALRLNHLAEAAQAAAVFLAGA